MSSNNKEKVVVTKKDLIILPPAPDKCQVCAVAHDPRQPHNQQSFYYQMAFAQTSPDGKGPTWEDAMAHCTDDVKKGWIAGLKKHGVEVKFIPASATCEHDYVPVGEYDQNGNFICAKCSHKI